MNTASTQAVRPTGMLHAGVAKRDITTDDPRAVILDPLYAKALVLDDGATKLAIVSMDATAIGGIGDVSDEFVPRVRQRIERELGIPGRHVLVHATHTHPAGRLLCDEAQQVARVFDAVAGAAAGAVPVKAGWGRGREERISMNRVLRLKDGRNWTIRHAHPCPPDDAVASVGPMDPEIGVLRIDRMDGRPLAVVYNFACHLLWANPRNTITANMAGVASRMIEAELGEGALALFLQGAAGDVVDVQFKEFSRPRDVTPLGHLLGLSTLAAVRQVRTSEARLAIIAEELDLPRRSDSAERIKSLLEEQQRLLNSLRSTSLNFKAFLPLYIQYGLNAEHPGDYAYRYMQDASVGNDEHVAMDESVRRQIGKYVENIRVMEALVRVEDDLTTLRKHQALNVQAGQTPIAAEVQGIRIGDGVLLTAPLELLTEVGLRVKRGSPHKHTFVAGYSNGYFHYGAPAADYAHGSYEVMECLLGPEWQELYQAKALEIARRL